MLLHLIQSYGHLHEQGQSVWGAAYPVPPHHLSPAGHLSLAGHRPLLLHKAYLQIDTWEHIGKSELRARNTFFFLSKALSWAYISSSKGDVLGNAKRSTVIPCPFSSALCLAYISDLLTCRYSLCIKEPQKKAPTLNFSFKPPFKGILSVTATKKKKIKGLLSGKQWVV